MTKAMKTHTVQTSESFLLGALLALSGGLQDAYTYTVRDHVFANAQTGNIVLMSQYLMTGHLAAAARLGRYAIWLSCALLALATALMTRERR